MKREIRHLPERDWKPYPTLDGLAADREIAETVHTMNGTGEAFRLIVLRRLNPQPSLFEAERNCYQSVASNRQEGAAEVNWKHNQRGNGENWHKELKSGPGMEQMPCGQFAANALCFCDGRAGVQLGRVVKVAGAAGRISHGDDGNAAMETVSAGRQAGAARAPLGAANQSTPGKMALIGFGPAWGVDREEGGQTSEHTKAARRCMKPVIETS